MAAGAALPPPAEAPVDHFILLFQENHSFDNLLGEFPGADGISQAGEAAVQVDRSGIPYKQLPPVLDDKSEHPRSPLSRNPLQPALPAPLLCLAARVDPRSDSLLLPLPTPDCRRSQQPICRLGNHRSPSDGLL
ncbi:alkaline phosphatase family protein [Verrucomicrobium sp. 3C]|uniref:alkaline phosphatase family protein n=1 Tax=Verrucomicrobium sp. 3C TaxID=1134055 RepID=UPI0034E07F6B